MVNSDESDDGVIKATKDDSGKGENDNDDEGLFKAAKGANIKTPETDDAYEDVK